MSRGTIVYRADQSWRDNLARLARGVWRQRNALRGDVADQRQRWKVTMDAAWDWQQRCYDAREDCDAALAEVARLRAVLAPLLDEPTEIVLTPTGWYARCRFCRIVGREGPHSPDCPVLRRDALLGRE